jgi:Cu(I)-responsive transcriptional regulator
MNIGQAAAASGVTAKMIRHYEESGLIRAARRTASNYRSYSDSDVHVLRFIKRARALGFSMADIKTLLSLWQDKSRSSSAVKRIAGTHIDELQRKIAELQAMVRTLEHLARHCHGDHRPECPIIEELAK